MHLLHFLGKEIRAQRTRRTAQVSNCFPKSLPISFQTCSRHRIIYSHTKLLIHVYIVYLKLPSRCQFTLTSSILALLTAPQTSQAIVSPLMSVDRNYDDSIVQSSDGQQCERICFGMVGLDAEVSDPP